MTPAPEDAAPPLWRVVLFRGGLFLVLWVACAGSGLLDLIVGLGASALAVAVSLHLLAPLRMQLDGVALVTFLPGFIARTAMAGWDVAARVFGPVPAVAPGVMSVPSRVPVGLARDTYRAMASLMPGTLPVGPDVKDTLSLHCLECDGTVAAGAAREEAAFLALARKR